MRTFALVLKKQPIPPPDASRPNFFRSFATHWVWVALGALLASGFSTLLLGRGFRPSKTVTGSAPIAAWGRLEAKPFLLEKPPELLLTTTNDLQPTRWHFAERARQSAFDFLASCGLDETQRVELATHGQGEETRAGFWMTPPPGLVVSLNRSVREKIYAELEKSHFNILQRHPFTISMAEAGNWFTRVGLPEDKVKLLNQMTYRRGSGVSFCDAEAAWHFLSPTEFHSLMRALASTDTLQLRLRIKPGDPVDQLAAYWGPGERASQVKTLLTSLMNRSGEVVVDVDELLPPLPRTWLYKFPQTAQDGAGAGDCFWTSLNFFREQPEPRFIDPNFRAAEFREHYERVARPERFGDIIVFANEQGQLHHACSYIASDIVFTKNGAQPRHPWVYMRLDEVRAIYHGNSRGTEAVFRRRST